MSISKIKRIPNLYSHPNSGINNQYKGSGTLTKLLQMGVQVEDDDDDFMLEPRKPGQDQLLFTQNNIEVDKDSG